MKTRSRLGVAPGPASVVRPGDRDTADAFEEGLLAIGERDAFGQHGVLEERGRDRPRARFHRHAHLKMRVGAFFGAVDLARASRLRRS